MVMLLRGWAWFRNSVKRQIAKTVSGNTAPLIADNSHLWWIIKSLNYLTTDKVCGYVQFTSFCAKIHPLGTAL